MKHNKLLMSALLAAGFGATILSVIVTGAETLTCDPGNGGITLPAGFCAVVAADNLGTARHLTVAPNGDVYVALQAKPGGAVALRDANGDGKFEIKEPFATGSVTGIAIRNGYLYLAKVNSAPDTPPVCARCWRSRGTTMRYTSG